MTVPRLVQPSATRIAHMGAAKTCNTITPSRSRSQKYEARTQGRDVSNKGGHVHKPTNCTCHSQRSALHGTYTEPSSLCTRFMSKTLRLMHSPKQPFSEPVLSGPAFPRARATGLRHHCRCRPHEKLSRRRPSVQIPSTGASDHGFSEVWAQRLRLSQPKGAKAESLVACVGNHPLGFDLGLGSCSSRVALRHLLTCGSDRGRTLEKCVNNHV